MEQQGRPLPRFVVEEFERFLECGILAHGFCQLACPCGHRRLVAFSCKRRGWCTTTRSTKTRRAWRPVTPARFAGASCWGPTRAHGWCISVGWVGRSRLLPTNRRCPASISMRAPVYRSATEKGARGCAVTYCARQSAASGCTSTEPRRGAVSRQRILTDAPPNHTRLAHVRAIRLEPPNSRPAGCGPPPSGRFFEPHSGLLPQLRAYKTWNSGPDTSQRQMFRYD